MWWPALRELLIYFYYCFSTAKRSMNSVLSFKSDQRTLTGPEAAAAKKYLTLSGSSGVVLDQCTGPTTRRQQAICIFTSILYVEITTAEGRHFPKLFLMHDIKLWPCGIERPQFKLIWNGMDFIICSDQGSIF